MKREIPQQTIGTFHQSPVTVTWDLNEESLRQQLTSEDYKLFTILFEKVKSEPKKTLSKTLFLTKKYPHVPEVNNLTIYNYIRLRRIKKAEKAIQTNYEMNKDHLISKINYADLLLRTNRLKEIPHLFNETDDLAKLTSCKKTYHASEYRAFHTFFGYLRLKEKNKEHASYHHYLAYKIDPHHSSVQLLGSRLSRKTLKERLIEMYYTITNI